MNYPPHTADIFKMLSSGDFISSNSSNREVETLYQVIDENFDDLHDYFRQINFMLERGDEYFYFSRAEKKVDLETKIQKAYRWIDILDFLKTFDNAFTTGFRFSPSEILVSIKTDAELESKLEGLKKYTDKTSHQEILERILKQLCDETFIELENATTNQYKVMAAFKYLEQLVLTIHIPEDISNEIPE